MRPSNDVLAILSSDWHLSEHAPVARSAEKCWFAAMERPINEIKGLMDKYNCHLIVAGDLFDKFGPSPTLLNWCLDVLPEMYAIPGQHDLPHHRYEDIERSAFQTLVKAHIILSLKPGVEVYPGRKLILWGVPWGYDLVNIKPSFAGDPWIKLAVLHRYVWDKGNKHPGATQEQHVSALREELIRNGYTHAVIGDNHKGFLSGIEVPIFNCGTLMRRKADERDYRPWVGLLHADGSITPHCLDCSEDKWIAEPLNSEMLQRSENAEDMQALIDELNATEQCALTFAGALLEYMESHKVSPAVRDIIVKSLEGKK